MILKSIRLRNIRSYTEQRIDLPSGAVLLSGDIGSGKSTILHAVEFALFGLRRDSLSGDALLRKGARSGEVELSFEIEGHRISILRSLKKTADSVGQDAGHITVDSVRDDGTATELKSRIISLLGYPKDALAKPNIPVYRYTVYTPQEEMKHILFDDPEGRIDTLRKIFGIDRYQRVADNAAIFLRWLKECKKEMSGSLYDFDEKLALLGAKAAEFEGAQARKALLLPVIEDLRVRKTAKRSEFEDAEQKVKRLEEAKHRLELNDAKLEEIIARRGANNAELQKLGEEISLLGQEASRERALLGGDAPFDVETVEDDIRALEKDIEFMNSRKASLKERREHILRRVSELEDLERSRDSKLALAKSKEELRNSLLEEVKDRSLMEKDLEGLNAKLRDAESRIAETRAHLSNSSSLKSKISSLSRCPTCLQDVTEDHKRSIISSEDSRLAKLEADLGVFSKARDDLLELAASLDRRLKAVSSKEKDLAEMRGELAGLRSLSAEMADLSKRRKEAEDEKARVIMAFESIDDRILEERRAELERKRALLKGLNERRLVHERLKRVEAQAADRSRRMADISAAQERLKEGVKRINVEKFALNGAVESLKSYVPFLEAVKKDLDLLADEEMKEEIVLAEVNKEIESLERALTLLKKEVDGKKERRAKLDRLDAVQLWTEEKFLPLVATIEKHVFAQVHSQFAALFAEWFSMLIVDDNLSVRLDDTFAPLVSQNGHDIDLAHLSGGEKTAIALAYRLALNRVINDLIFTIKTRDLLILDEPTDGFSSEQLDRVRDVLQQLGVKQTIIVSHESKIESFVDHVIRIEKTDHVSRVVN